MNALLLRILLYIAAVLIGAAGAWMWQANSYTAILAVSEANHQSDLAMISAAGGKALDKQQVAEQALADLDQKAQKEKTDAIAENEKLRADVAAGTRRLRIAGSCRASGGDVSSSTGAAGVGDAASVELTEASGRTLLDIRAGIIADQAALKALQAYVLNVCRPTN